MHLIGKPNSDFTLQSQMVMHGIYGKAQLNNSANKWGAWWLWRSARQSIYPTANHGPPPCSGPGASAPPSPMVKTALDMAHLYDYHLYGRTSACDYWLQSVWMSGNISLCLAVQSIEYVGYYIQSKFFFFFFFFFITQIILIVFLVLK